MAPNEHVTCLHAVRNRPWTMHTGADPGKPREVNLGRTKIAKTFSECSNPKYLPSSNSCMSCFSFKVVSSNQMGSDTPPEERGILDQPLTTSKYQFTMPQCARQTNERIHFRFRIRDRRQSNLCDWCKTSSFRTKTKFRSSHLQVRIRNSFKRTNVLFVCFLVGGILFHFILQLPPPQKKNMQNQPRGLQGLTHRLCS